MRKITFEELSDDQIRALTFNAQELSLEALQVPQIEGLCLPYRQFMATYEWHVDHCQTCQSTPVWDIGCESGAALAHRAADAMSRQDTVAAQN